MNIYDIDKLLKDHRSFKKENEYCYSAIFFKGEFELFDYDAGILKVSIYLAIPDSPTMTGLISISTVDDGLWTAECNRIVTEEIAQKAISIFNKHVHLPSEKDLNLELIKIGFYGQFTG